MLRIVIPNQLILNSQIPRLLFICYKTNTTTSVSRSVYPQFANTEGVPDLFPDQFPDQLSEDEETKRSTKGCI
ncbi:hypothetical protein C1H46_030107 [Malus baccata]|uniref:Uncharacterized protein n=1 Tax=Malus baccata TaxID=106549 RepID=A0A540LCW8_MALBA|nr:hypothetical protein C1H46_030107 [Malus baccata]